MSPSHLSFAGPVDVAILPSPQDVAQRGAPAAYKLIAETILMRINSLRRLNLNCTGRLLMG